MMSYKELLFKYLFVIVFIGFLPCARVSLAEVKPEPFVVIQQANKKALFRGEKINFYIKLLSTGIFSGTPRFELPTLSTGLLYQVQARPVLGSETVEGKSYTSQLYEIWFFPQQAGEITIPAIHVTFSTTENGTKSEKKYSQETTPFSFNVKPIPDVRDDEFVIVTDDFQASQAWNREVDQGIVGDAVVRTIFIRVKNMASIFLPDIEIHEIEGVSIYRDAPEVSDRNERGEATAERKDVITYVFESPGDYIISDITMKWWDNASRKVRQNVLKGITATIVVNPNKKEEGSEVAQATGKESTHFGFIALMSGICFFISFVFIKKYDQFKDYFRILHKTRLQSEKAYFQRFKNACDNNDQIAAFNALYLWIQKTYGHKDLRSIAGLEKGNSAFQMEFERLNKLLFEKNGVGKQEIWQGERLYKSVKRIRKTEIKWSNEKEKSVNWCRLNY